MNYLNTLVIIVLTGIHNDCQVIISVILLKANIMEEVTSHVKIQFFQYII